MFIMIFCLVLLQRAINWNFFGLGFIEFTLNHFNMFCISIFRSFKIVCRLILQLYSVFSSKLHILVLSIRRKRSLINKLKIISLKLQPVITTRIYVQHKITIALKFLFYINSDLPIPAKKPQASHNVQSGITAWKPVGS